MTEKIDQMDQTDPNGLKELLERMNFKVIEDGEKIIAHGRDYEGNGKKIWVNDFEEILDPSVYGYIAIFKRWKIIFVPY